MQSVLAAHPLLKPARSASSRLKGSHPLQPESGVRSILLVPLQLRTPKHVDQPDSPPSTSFAMPRATVHSRSPVCNTIRSTRRDYRRCLTVTCLVACKNRPTVSPRPGWTLVPIP